MAKFGLSQPMRRIEDPRLLIGGGRYTDDIAPAGAAHGAVLRSPHAAAKILSIDTAAALEVPGVLAVDVFASAPVALLVRARDLEEGPR